MLEIKSLDYQLGRTRLFSSLELTIERGEHCVIVGGSGGGKSTLLKLIAEQRHPQVLLPDGANVAMVMQEGALLDHLSVLGNLELVARYNRLANAGAEIERLLRSLGIGADLESAQVNQLSGGQQRRVSIARALLSKPDVLIFDEPDAGLDVANLAILSSLVTEVAKQHNCACLTVSHNPLYIAGVATKVLRLRDGQLHEIATWGAPAGGDVEQTQRQTELQSLLSLANDTVSNSPRARRKVDWVFPLWLNQLPSTVLSLVTWPQSTKDALSIAAYAIYLSFVSGILFFALVGLMLGTTTIAVVQMLADTALTGFISLFIKPADLIDLMGGRYALYLAPAIGGMLFAARSGSIMSNWLGEMRRGKQLQALTLLGVPPTQYIVAPSLIGVFVSMLASITWFAICVWLGGVIATQYLFEVNDPVSVMMLSGHDIALSQYWVKTVCYSVMVSLTVVALGTAPKYTSHQVSIHTTKTIIYSTICIALAELLIILSR